MHAQDTAHPSKTEYRGADWRKVQSRWSERSGRSGAAARPAASVLRLGSSVHFDRYPEAVKGYQGPAYLATLTGYPENGCELVLRTVHEQPRNPTLPRDTPPKPRLKAGTPRTEMDPFLAMRSAAHARAEIRKWIRMTCTPGWDYRLVTLTKRDGLKDHKECTAALAKFRRRVDKHYPGVSFIAVWELHLGGGANHGTYHIHCVMVFPPGRQPNYGIFHRLWWKALGGTGKEAKESAPGNCDFARTHAKDGTRYTACQAARYLSKYVTKHILAGNVGEKRYTATHGVPVPVKRYWWEPIDTNHQATRSRAIQLLRAFYPAKDYMVLHSTFSSGGDTYHVFSAEPVPRLTG